MLLMAKGEKMGVSLLLTAAEATNETPAAKMADETKKRKDPDADTVVVTTLPEQITGLVLSLPKSTPSDVDNISNGDSSSSLDTQPSDFNRDVPMTSNKESSGGSKRLRTEHERPAVSHGTVPTANLPVPAQAPAVGLAIAAKSNQDHGEEDDDNLIESLLQQEDTDPWALLDPHSTGRDESSSSSSSSSASSATSSDEEQINFHTQQDVFHYTLAKYKSCRSSNSVIATSLRTYQGRARPEVENSDQCCGSISSTLIRDHVKSVAKK